MILLEKLSWNKVYFHLNGYVNKQNSRIWGVENQQVIHEKAATTSYRLVKIFDYGVVGSYIVEDDACNSERNGERYLNMITEFLGPALVGMVLDNMWFP